MLVWIATGAGAGTGLVSTRCETLLLADSGLPIGGSMGMGSVTGSCVAGGWRGGLGATAGALVLAGAGRVILNTGVGCLWMTAFFGAGQNKNTPTTTAPSARTTPAMRSRRRSTALRG